MLPKFRHIARTQKIPLSCSVAVTFACQREKLCQRAANLMNPVKTFLLSHPSSISASVSNFGATLRSLSVPDREGRIENILVGFEKEDQWRENESLFGVTAGRYANRIAKGRFQLDGKTYELTKNNHGNHLHGGHAGFDKVMWEAEQLSEQAVRFSRISPDGEEGYPGNLEVIIDYVLGENSLTWEANATCDQATPVNLTSHGYFNLSGEPLQSVLGHELRIAADHYLPVDETTIPTGELRPVDCSGFDFRLPTRIRENLQLNQADFDHNFVLNQESKGPNATCFDPASGRRMELFTNQPGLQFYLSSQLGGTHNALCLEPQKFPDSPNQSNFPSSILRPGETYTNSLCLRFPKP
jgi:aldose 1-epimerase